MTFRRVGQTGPEPTGLSAFQRGVMHQGHQRDCTPEIRDRVVAAIRRGFSTTQAAKRAGIEPKRLDVWLRLGAETYQAGGPYRELYLAVSRAEADWEEEQRAGLEELKASDPHVAFKVYTFLLKTRLPEEYSDKTTTRHEMAHPATVNEVQDHVTDEQLADALERALSTIREIESTAEVVGPASAE